MKTITAKNCTFSQVCQGAFMLAIRDHYHCFLAEDLHLSQQWGPYY